MSRFVTLFVVVCFFVLGMSELSATEPCPTGWKFNSANNHCYNLEATASPVTWVQAKAACAAYNARTNLVSLGDQTENDLIYNYVKTEKAYNGNIWIGLEANDAYPVSGNETCSNAVIVPILGRKFSGSIGTGTGTVDPYGDCDMPGKENFFRITPAVSGTWTFKVTSVFDAVIDLYSGACTSYIDCEDYNGANATDTMTRTLTAGQTYTVVVDKYRTTDSGTYTLEIMAPTDNGKRAYSWIDDTDNGYTNWDTNEPSNSDGNEACGELKIGTTTYGKWNDLPCNSTTALHAYVCEYISSICGDNVVEGIEECDDGNLTDGDGCDANCRPTGCGNGRVTGTEQCDDGNVIDLDACNNDCTYPCPDGWAYSAATGKCYDLLGIGATKTWTEAKDTCPTTYGNGTTLATIGTQAENDFVFNYVKYTQAYNGNTWIGLDGATATAVTGNESCSTAWIVPGMGRKYSGYIGAGTGTVDPYGDCDMPGKENFFRFTAAVSGTWTFKIYSAFDAVIDLYSGSCGSYMDCEDYYSANATDTMTYSLTAGQTYTVVVDKYSTSDYGAYTLDIMPPTDRGVNAYAWIDGTDSTYTNWDSNEPTGATEACGEMKIVTTTNAKWNDLACNSSSVKLAYTCETQGNILAMTNITSVTTLDLSNRGLTSLEGIQAFSSLAYLNIAGNPVTGLEPLRELVNLQQITATPQEGGSAQTITRLTGEAINDFVNRGITFFGIIPFGYQELSTLQVYYNFEYIAGISYTGEFGTIVNYYLPNVAPNKSAFTNRGTINAPNEDAYLWTPLSAVWQFGKVGYSSSATTINVESYTMPAQYTISVRNYTSPSSSEQGLLTVSNSSDSYIALKRYRVNFIEYVKAVYKVSAQSGVQEQSAQVPMRIAYQMADHYALSCNSTCDLYANGEKILTGLPEIGGTVALGGVLVGWMDEFRIHSEALDQERIRDLYFFNICPLYQYHDMNDTGVCKGTCGDGDQAADEECDDGANGINTDGCYDTCQLGSVPKGYLDGAQKTGLWGWTCDVDNYSVALSVRLEFRDANGDLYATEAVTADAQRESAVGDQCGGNAARGYAYDPSSKVAAMEAAGKPKPYVVSAFAENIGTTPVPAGLEWPALIGNPKTIVYCGNTVPEGTEQCDDGDTDNTDDCLIGCISASCGDGNIWSGHEACDDGANNGAYGHCKTDCSGIGPHCGDGTVNGSEVCDDGVNDGSYNGCMSDCAAVGPHCGDGVVQSANETCDGTDLSSQTCATQVSGATGGTLSCSSSCDVFVTTACTKTYTCADKPTTGTAWNTVSNYLQTWNATAWVPADDPTTEYNATGSTTECRYTCDTDYTYENGACIHSKQVECDQTKNPGDSYNIVAYVTVEYFTANNAWDPPAACMWRCYQDETHGYFVREDNACIHEKVIDCPGTTNDLEYVYSEPDITLTLISCSGANCEWLGDDGETYNTTISTETTEVASWPEKDKCPCITGTYRSQAADPLTECVPYEAIDFMDKNLHLCLRRFIPWTEAGGVTEYFLTPEDLDDPLLSMVDCTYDNPDNYSGEEKTKILEHNTINVPDYQPETIVQIQSLRGIEYIRNLKELYLGGNAVHDLKPLTKLAETGFYGKHYEIDRCWSPISVIQPYFFTYELSEACEDSYCEAAASACPSSEYQVGVYISYSDGTVQNEEAHEILCFQRSGDAQEVSVSSLTEIENGTLYERQLYSTETEAINCSEDFTPERLLIGFAKDAIDWSIEPPALEILDLSNNAMSAGDLEGLDKLTQLKYLVLSDNTLHDLSQGTFFNLTDLLGLDLSANGMDDIDIITIKDMPNLTHLYLAGNQIETLNADLGEIETVCSCQMGMVGSVYMIVSCDSEYKGCLCSMISGECCSQLDENFNCTSDKQRDYLLRHLTVLERLDLRDNPLDTLWGIPLLTGLLSLDIGLSGAFTGVNHPLDLTKLQHVETHLYSGLLEYLDLSGRLTATDMLDITPIQNMANLRNLSLKQTQTAPVGFGGNLTGLNSLRTLDISGLRIDSLSMIDSMTHLQVLVAENACITDPEPLITHERVGYARLTNNCIPTTDKLTSLLNEHIIGEESLAQRTPGLCNTLCTAYKICEYAPTRQQIACADYDARYGSGTAYCNEDGFSYDVSECVELETPDDDTLFNDELLTEEDTLLDDSDEGESSGGTGTEDVPRSAQCEGFPDNLPLSYHEKPYCKCGEGSHAVYYSLADASTWRCVKDDTDPQDDGLEDVDPGTIPCLTEDELALYDERNIAYPGWCTAGGTCIAEGAVTLEMCLNELFMQSPCGYYYFNRECKDRIALLNGTLNLTTPASTFDHRVAEVQKLESAFEEEQILGDNTAQNYIDLPVPAMRGYGYQSTFAGHMNRMQAIIHNYIRPVNLKFPQIYTYAHELHDPYLTSDMYGYSADIRNMGQYQYYNTAGTMVLPDVRSMLLRAAPITELDTVVDTTTGTIGGLGTINIGGILNNPLFGEEGLTLDIIQTGLQPFSATVTSAEPTLVDLKDRNMAIFSQLLTKVKVNGVTRRDWIPDADIRSCEQYVYQKYYDFTRSLDIVAAYEKHPEDTMALLYGETSWDVGFFGTAVAAFTDLGPDNSMTLTDGTTGRMDVPQLGNYRNIACHPLFAGNMWCNYPDSGNPERMLPGSYMTEFQLKKGKNLFWEVIYQLAEKQGVAQTEINGRPNIINGLPFMNIPQPIRFSALTYGEPDYTTETFSYYAGQAAYYQDQVTGDQSAEEQLRLAKKLKERLLQLLKYRANMELLWNEKREFVKEFQHGNLSQYDVAEIRPIATTLLKNLSIYRPVVTKLEDIMDPKIRAMYNPETNSDYAAYLETLRVATEDLRKQTWKTLEGDIRDNRYLETVLGRKLWSRYHYGKDAYQNEHAAPGEVYVRGDTEELIELALEEIDAKIIAVIQQAAGAEDIVVNKREGNLLVEDRRITLDCLDPDPLNPNICDLDAERFVEHLSELVPSAVMERDYKKCMDYYKDDFDTFNDELTEVTPFTVFQPDWETVYAGVYPGYETMTPQEIASRLQSNTGFVEQARRTANNLISGYWNFTINPYAAYFFKDVIDGSGLPPVTWEGTREINADGIILAQNTIALSSSGLGGNNFTVSFTFKPSSTLDVSVIKRLITLSDNVFVQFVNGMIFVKAGPDSNDGIADDSKPIPSTVFTNISVVFEEVTTGTKITIFRNGEQTAQGTVNEDNIPVSSSMVVGGTDTAAWSGAIRQVTVFNKAIQEGPRLRNERDVKAALSMPLLQENIYNVQAFIDAYDAFKKNNVVPDNDTSNTNPKSTKQRADDLGIEFGGDNYVDATTFHYGENLCDLRYEDILDENNVPTGEKILNCVAQPNNVLYVEGTNGSLLGEMNARCGGTSWLGDFTTNSYCLEAYIMLNDAWKSERATITRRVEEVTKQLKQNKEQLKVMQLAQVMQMEPSTPGTQSNTLKKKRKDSIKKYFSEYEFFGDNEYVGVEYSYIAGGGIYQIDIDWDQLNPIPDLRQFEPLLAQVLNELLTTLCAIGKAKEAGDPDDYKDFMDECRVIDVEAFADDPALMGQLFHEVADALKEMPACLLYDSPGGKEARRLITAVQKFINMFKGFNPKRMEKGAMEMLPDVDPEDFLYALAERLLKNALQTTLNQQTGVYDTVARVQKVQKAVQNDVAKVKGKVKQVGDMVSAIKKVVEGLKSGDLLANADPELLGEPEALAEEVFGLMAQEILIDFISANVEIEFAGNITYPDPMGTVEQITKTPDELKKEFLMSRELIEDIIKQAKTFDPTQVVEENSELTCDGCDEFLFQLYKLTKDPTGGFAAWFSGVIGDPQVSIDMVNKIEEVIQGNSQTGDTGLNFQNVLAMAQSIPIPQWDMSKFNDGLSYNTLLEKIGDGTGFFTALNPKLQNLLTQKIREAYKLPVSTSINFTIGFAAEAKVNLPDINFSLAQRALMRLLERKTAALTGPLQTFFAEMQTAFNGVNDEGKNLATLLQEDLLNELETPKAIAALSQSEISITPPDPEVLAEGIVDTLTTELGNLAQPQVSIPMLMQVYIDAAAEQFNFDILNEILSGNFDYEDFIRQNLLFCINEQIDPDVRSLLNHKVRNGALKEAMCVNQATCTLGDILGNAGNVIDGIEASVDDPTMLKEKATDLGMSLMNGVMNRMVEIIMQKLMMLPYGEFVMHGRADVHYFNSSENVFESTAFITTRFRESVPAPDDPKCDPLQGGNETACDYARLDGAKTKARDWFISRYDSEIRQFEVYNKFYAKDIGFGLQDSILDTISAKLREELGITDFIEGLLPEEVSIILAAYSTGNYTAIAELAADKAGVNPEKIKEQLEKALVDLQKELTKLAAQAEKEGGLTFGDPENVENGNGAGGNKEEWGERHNLVDLPYEDQFSTWIAGVVPVMLQWGVHLTVDVYLKYYWDYGMVANDAKGGDTSLGLTAGLGVTPYVYADGYIAAGLGIDFEVVSVFVGIEGNVVFIDFSAPFRMQALIGAEFTDGDLAAKLYLSASLTPRLTLLDADLKLKVQAEVLGFPITYRKTIADWKPLIDRDYGNIIPLKPLDINLFSLGQIMNAIQ